MYYEYLVNTVYSVLADTTTYSVNKDLFYIYNAMGKIDAIIKELEKDINEEGR